MATQDRPFSETEKVNLLAEIIKSSSVPPERLLDIIYEYRVETQWGEIVRPPGRSPQACKQAFDDIRGSHPVPTPRPQSGFFQAPPTSFIHRPYVPLDTSQAVAPGRTIQPRPHGVPPTQYSPVSSPYTTTPPEQSFKKRGRPTNAEKEQRKHEYEARGEQYPPPRSRKRSKATTTNIVQAGTSPKTAGGGGGPTSAATGEASGSSSKQGSFLGHSPRSPAFGQQMNVQHAPGRSPVTMEPPPTSVPQPRQSPYSGNDRVSYQPQQNYPPYPSHYSHSQPLAPQPQQPPPPPHHQQYTSTPSHGMRLPRLVSTPASGPSPPEYARSHEPGLPGLPPPPSHLQAGTGSTGSSGPPSER